MLRILVCGCLFAILTACAHPVVVQSREGWGYKTPDEMTAEAASICKKKHGKNGVRFERLTFGQSMGDPARLYYCTD